MTLCTILLLKWQNLKYLLSFMDPLANLSTIGWDISETKWVWELAFLKPTCWKLVVSKSTLVSSMYVVGGGGRPRQGTGNNETRLELLPGCLGSSLIQIDSQLPCQTIGLFCYTFCLLESLHGIQLGECQNAVAAVAAFVIIIRYTMSWFNGHHQPCRHLSWLLQKLC